MINVVFIDGIMYRHMWTVKLHCYCLLTYVYIRACVRVSVCSDTAVTEFAVERILCWEIRG